MAYFKIASNVYTGESALDDASEIIRSFGDKALIVTGKHVGKSPMMEELKRFLVKNDISYTVYDGITSEPTVPMLDEGAEIYRKEGCSFVIGLGGGSPLDSAKGIAAMAEKEGKISDFAGKEITGSHPPVVCIPTTAGTGSETTQFIAISDPVTDVKMLLRGISMIPEVAILNPAYTVDMTKSITSSTGLDALTHAVEAYTSKKATPLTDPYAAAAVKAILEYLPKAYNEGYDIENREKMMVAAFEAGVCISNSSVTLVHGMSRPIGALFHVPHGLSNAMLLNVCLTFAAEGAPERFGELAKAVGAAAESDNDVTASKKLLEKINEVVKICEVPTLWEYGVDHDKFEAAIDKMSEDAVASGSPGNTRRPVSVDDCKMLYRKLL